MAITLAQAKVGMADKVDQAVIDEFRRESFILDRLTFDNAVSPGTGGSTLTYGYLKLKTPSVAAGRAINAEYTPGEAVKEECTAKVKIMGGSFQVDRVLEDTAAKSEIAFQLSEKVKATRNLFHYLFINGNATNDSKQFDGIDVQITNTSTEVTPDSAIDLSTSANIASNGPVLVEKLHYMMSLMAEKPDVLLMNGRMKSILQTIGYNLGYYSRVEDSFGRQVDTFDGVPMIDMGKYYNGEATVDSIGNDENGCTSIYAVKLGLNGVHGISPVGNKVVKTYLPNMSEPGAVKTGEVELLAGVVVKNSLLAGALRNIKIVTPTISA